MPTKYEQIIAHIFHEHFDNAASGFEFPRSAIQEAANELNLGRVSNVGDAIYTFRSRKPLPDSIRATATGDREWVIRTVATGTYRFDLLENATFPINPRLAETLIPDSTPALIQLYSQSDEQALLAIIRYNRLVDIFVRLSCFSVQSHLRTNLTGSGQVEIDELYVGIDRRGAHYVIPIEVKSRADTIGYVQVDNMFELSAQRFPHLIPRVLGAQFVDDDLIALFEFERRRDSVEIDIVSEQHYRLVPSEDLPDDLIVQYGNRSED